MNAMLSACAILALALAPSCAVDWDASHEDPAGGPETGVRVTVAPLGWAEIGDATYRLTVTTASGELVARRELHSNAFGSGRGDLSYVAPCLPDGGEHQVTLALIDLRHRDDLTPIARDRYQPPDLQTRSVSCRADRRTEADFALTLAHAPDAPSDTGLSFDGLTCQASLRCDPVESGALAGAPAATLRLSCTAAADADTPTPTLLLDPLEVTCGEAVALIDPAASSGVGAHLPGVRQAGAAPLLVAVSSQRHTKLSGQTRVVSWQTSFTLDPAIGTRCRLRARGAARHRPTASLSAISASATPGDTAWPLIVWDAPLTDAAGAPLCRSYTLGHADGVTVAYTSPRGQTALAQAYDGGALTTGCHASCGRCAGPGPDACTSCPPLAELHDGRCQCAPGAVDAQDGPGLRCVDLPTSFSADLGTDYAQLPLGWTQVSGWRVSGRTGLRADPAFDPATGRFTAPVGGVYHVSANVRVDGVDEGAIRALISVDGERAPLHGLTARVAAPGIVHGTTVHVDGVVALARGEGLALWVHNAAAHGALLHSDTGFSVSRLPTAPGLRAALVSPLSVHTTGQVLVGPWTSQGPLLHDTMAAGLDPTGDSFTATEDGGWYVSATVRFADVTPGARIELGLATPGQPPRVTASQRPAGPEAGSITVSGIIALRRGERLAVVARSDDGDYRVLPEGGLNVQLIPARGVQLRATTPTTEAGWHSLARFEADRAGVWLLGSRAEVSGAGGERVRLLLGGDEADLAPDNGCSAIECQPHESALLALSTSASRTLARGDGVEAWLEVADDDHWQLGGGSGLWGARLPACTAADPCPTQRYGQACRLDARCFSGRCVDGVCGDPGGTKPDHL